LSLRLAQSNLLGSPLLPASADFATLLSHSARAPFHPHIPHTCMALFLGPASPAPYGPTTRHGTRFPGPHATTSRVTSPHQGHAPCSRYDSASLITAHPLTTSWHVPSFQAGPSAPALTRMARTPPSRPPPDPAGPCARPGLVWARTHHGPPVTPHGPAPRGTAGPNASRTPGQATRKANC